MSNYLFEQEVKYIMGLGVPQDLALLTASSKLEDKTLFNAYIEKFKERNDAIESYLHKQGFKLSTDNVEEEKEEVKQDEPTTDENKDKTV
jgi:hypothetical protein